MVQTVEFMGGSLEMLGVSCLFPLFKTSGTLKTCWIAAISAYI